MATSAPAEQDLTVYQGQDWTAVFELYQDTANTIPFDLTGYEIDMHVREGVADSAADLKIAASTRDTGDGAGRIQIIGRQSSGEVDVDGGEVPSDGVFKITLPAAVTAAVSPTKAPRKGDLATAEFVYDVEITSSTGIITRIMKGTFTLDLEVTRRT
jgi:hypothetical protein